MADHEAYQAGLTEHTAAYTSTIIDITSIILQCLYVIVIFLMLNGIFFLVQRFYARLTFRLFYPRDVGKLEHGPMIFGVLVTWLGAVMLIIYLGIWLQEIAYSTSEHWCRDVFLLASAPVLVVLVLETAGLAILAILVGMYRACCGVCGRSAKKDEEFGLVNSRSGVEGEGVDDKAAAAHNECVEGDEAGLCMEEEVRKDSLDCQTYEFKTS